MASYWITEKGGYPRGTLIRLSEANKEYPRLVESLDRAKRGNFFQDKKNPSITGAWLVGWLVKLFLVGSLGLANVGYLLIFYR